MNIEIPEINDLISKVTGLEQRLLNLEDKVDPKQKWFTLKQACLLKGLNYNTVCSRPKLQPNCGKADATSLSVVPDCGLTAAGLKAARDF